MRYLIWKENTFCTASKGYNSLVIFDIVPLKIEIFHCHVMVPPAEVKTHEFLVPADTPLSSYRLGSTVVVFPEQHVGVFLGG